MASTRRPLVVAIPILVAVSAYLLVRRDSDRSLATMNAQMSEPIEFRTSVTPGNPLSNSSNDAADVSVPPATVTDVAVAESRTGVPVLVEQILTVSGAISPTAESDYVMLMESLTARRAENAAVLHSYLSSLPPLQKFAYSGRQVVRALGYLAHKSSLPYMEELLDEQLPEPSPGHNHIDHRSEIVLTQSAAVRVLHAIAMRYETSEVIAGVVAELESIIAEEGGSPHLKLVCADVLLTHAADPNARMQELATMLGPDAPMLLNLEIRSSAPPKELLP